MSYGSSGIVDPRGRVLAVANPLASDFIVAEIACGRAPAAIC